MAVWLRGIAIKDFLAAYDDHDDIERVKREVLGVLRADPDPKIARDIADELEYVVEDEAEFNGLLEELYDYADVARIWVGTADQVAAINGPQAPMIERLMTALREADRTPVLAYDHQTATITDVVGHELAVIDADGYASYVWPDGSRSPVEGVLP